MKVHEKVRKIRELKNFSQENMAEQLQMSVNGYAKIERGEVGLQMDKLEKIADVLGMGVVDLLTVEKIWCFSIWKTAPTPPTITHRRSSM